MWNEENPAQDPIKYFRLRKIDHKECIFLNIFASFEKIIRIFASICCKFDKNLHCPGMHTLTLIIILSLSSS